MTYPTARNARPTGGKCAPNGGKVRAQRGVYSRLTGCLSLWEIGSLQPLQSLHPLGGRDGGNAHARGLAIAAAPCAGRGEPIRLPYITTRTFFVSEYSGGTTQKAGINTGKTSAKTSAKTSKPCGGYCDHSPADVQVKPGFEIADPRFLPALCGAGGRRPHAGGPARRGRPRASCPDSGQTLILAPV
jgi:hypothetical protein